MEFLHRLNKVTLCSIKSEAVHWALKVKKRHINIAAWSYEESFESASKIKNHGGFYAEVVNYFSID